MEKLSRETNEISYQRKKLMEPHWKSSGISSVQRKNNALFTRKI
jgi:hypothetical protein